MKKKSFNCNVCFENKNIWHECEMCKICNFRTCLKCIVQSGKLFKKCFSCKNDNSDKYDFVYNVFLKK